MRFPSVLSGLLLSTLLACGGKAEVGEKCDTAGATTECADGAICTNDSGGGTFTCRKTCTEQAQCASGENCNGISGSSAKSCQPK